MQRFRVDDCAREAVIPDLAAFLDHHDGKLGACRLGKLLQAYGTGERRRSAADEQHVDFEGIAFCHSPLEFAHEAGRSRDCANVQVTRSIERIAVAATRCAAMRSSHGRGRGDSKVSAAGVPR